MTPTKGLKQIRPARIGADWRCIIVIKQTALAQGGRAAEMAKRGDETAQRLVAADGEHQRTADEVRKALKKRKIVFGELASSKLNVSLKRQLAAADFIISVGGDGTALSTSHYIRDGMLLGVNSAPGDSVGHFCSVNRANFIERLDAILDLSWRPIELARLQILFNDKSLPELALNDVLIAHSCPASTTRYLMTVGEREEEHRSSGIWISTAAGSTAGILSAGGRRMNLRSHQIQYLIRELYREPNREYELTRGLLAPEAEITVASKMPEGRLYIDGARTAYEFPFGARARIRAAEKVLRIFL